MKSNSSTLSAGILSRNPPADGKAIRVPSHSCSTTTMVDARQSLSFRYCRGLTTSSFSNLRAIRQALGVDLVMFVTPVASRAIMTPAPITIERPTQSDAEEPPGPDMRPDCPGETHENMPGVAACCCGYSGW